MSISQLSAFTALIFFLGPAFLLFRAWQRKHLITNLPPGPKQKDITGGTMIGERAVNILRQCRDEFGPVFTLQRAFNNPLIIVADYEAAMFILEKEGAANTAARPRAIAGPEIFARGMLTSQMQPGNLHSTYRRGLSSALRPSIALKYGPMQEEQAVRLAARILESPLDFSVHINRFAADTSISIAYGHSSLAYAPSTTTSNGSSHDAIVSQIRTMVTVLISTLQPGAFLVDTFPILQALPGWLYWPRIKLDRGYQETKTLFSGLIEGVRKARIDPNNEDSATSFASYILDNQISLGLTDLQTSFLGSTIFAAGTDTTASAIGWMICAAVMHPEAQKVVQDQIDEVVGRDRTPLASDESKLVAVVAFYLECYRWRPTVTSGLPHRATKDVAWNGYTIPAGAAIYGNHSLIGRSPSLFRNPEVFDPKRWLHEESGHARIREDVKAWGFGFGRRVCPGQHVANRSLFVSTAMLLWAFDIKPASEAALSDITSAVEAGSMRPPSSGVKFELRSGKEDLVALLGKV